jgi:hypothetical protein
LPALGSNGLGYNTIGYNYPDNSGYKMNNTVGTNLYPQSVQPIQTNPNTNTYNPPSSTQPTNLPQNLRPSTPTPNITKPTTPSIPSTYTYPYNTPTKNYTKIS